MQRKSVVYRIAAELVKVPYQALPKSAVNQLLLLRLSNFCAISDACR